MGTKSRNFGLTAERPVRFQALEAFNYPLVTFSKLLRFRQTVFAIMIMKVTVSQLRLRLNCIIEYQWFQKIII